MKATRAEAVVSEQAYCPFRLGSSPGPLAHREEQGTFNPKVPGSRPGRPTFSLVTGLKVMKFVANVANCVANGSVRHGFLRTNSRESGDCFAYGGWAETRVLKWPWTSFISLREKSIHHDLPLRRDQRPDILYRVNVALLVTKG